VLLVTASPTAFQIPFGLKTVVEIGVPGFDAPIDDDVEARIVSACTLLTTSTANTEARQVRPVPKFMWMPSTPSPRTSLGLSHSRLCGRFCVKSGHQNACVLAELNMNPFIVLAT
jgi:hypothetical protein